MQLLFYHLEPDVHTSNVPTCVDSFLVQGTSFTSIPPNRIACAGRSMNAWHSANAAIMCKAHKTSWREVKLQQRPHSLGQLFIKSFFFSPNPDDTTITAQKTRNEKRQKVHLRWGADNSERMLPYSLRFKNLAAKHSNRIWLEKSYCFLKGLNDCAGLKNVSVVFKQTTSPADVIWIGQLFLNEDFQRKQRAI